MAKQKYITSKPAFGSVFLWFYLILFVWFSYVIFSASLFEQSELIILSANGLMIIAILAAILFPIIKYVSIKKLIKQRQQAMQALLPLGTENGSSSDFVPSSLAELDSNHIVHNRRFYNVLEGDDYKYADYSYEIYQRSKYGEHLDQTKYYAVMATKFPRQLPHVLFDSLKARSRQFRFIFAGNQLHELEGDFSKHFAVYFPFEYTIDSMSFVTPDVMWAIKEAAYYDVEIIGDHLYIFGAQGDPSIQIPEMSSKLAAIKKTLIRTTAAYRDERLPYSQGRQGVAPIGSSLAKSLFYNYIGLALSLAATLVGIIVMTRGTMSALLFMGVAFTWFNYKKINTERERRKKLVEMTKSLNQPRPVPQHKTELAKP